MKETRLKASSLFMALALLLFCGSAWAQRQGLVTIKGTITEQVSDGTSAPIPYATVQIPSAGMSAVANERGEYVIKGIAPATYEFIVASLGYETLNLKVNVTAAKEVYDFKLRLADFRLDDITVTAEASKAGAATASKINRTAIEHIQASSLADVMVLLPGADITSSTFKPDLQGVKTLSVRGGNAMGTAIIMDGAPVSNAANMQTMSAAIGGAAPGSGGQSPTSGIDLRTITTDNVESVEVIQGIASVEYGNASAGTVIVNAKSGVEPLSIKFNTNPNVYAIGATHGFSLGEGNGFINYGVDYARSVADPREGYDKYHRSTGRVAYSNTFFGGKFYTNTSLNYLWTKEKAEPNPEDESDWEYRNRRDKGIRITHNGEIKINAGWFKNIKYTASFNYTNRWSYYKDQGTNADVAYSYSKIDGSVLSSRPGTLIYDDAGKVLTWFGPNDELANDKSWITPASYTYEYNVYGKELNTFAKMLLNFSGNIGKSSHHIILGADFYNDGNKGKGKVFDYDNPPYRSVSYRFATQRERPYKEIPFMNKLGVYAQEDFRVPVWAGGEFKVVAGVRWDKVWSVSDAFSPRINASLDIIPGVFSIRGGYGVSVTAPSMAYVYPDNAYFDMVNFNNSLQTTVPDAQKFQLITTHVYDIKNHDLELAKQKKAEVGFDLKIKKVKLSVTAYKDKSNNGYTFSRGLNDYQWVNWLQYKAGPYPGDGSSLPNLILDKNGKVFLEYTRPGNNRAYEQKGIEFVLDFGRINAIRTSFLVNGEFYDYKSWSNGWVWYNKNGSEEANMGIYSSKDASGIGRDQNLITNFIITHNIPKIGFVVSLTANVNWRQKSWYTYAACDTIPVKYLSIEDGQVHDFDAAWANPSNPDYAKWLPILRNEENGAIAHNRKQIEPAYNPVLCINVNVTKQFKNFDVSFFANNMFRSTPLQSLVKRPGDKVRRNSDVFFFGLQLTARIK